MDSSLLFFALLCVGAQSHKLQWLLKTNGKSTSSLPKRKLYTVQCLLFIILWRLPWRNWVEKEREREINKVWHTWRSIEHIGLQIVEKRKKTTKKSIMTWAIGVWLLVWFYFVISKLKIGLVCHHKITIDCESILWYHVKFITP